MVSTGAPWRIKPYKIIPYLPTLKSLAISPLVENWHRLFTKQHTWAIKTLDVNTEKM